MIDLIRFSNRLLAEADEYADKARTPGETVVMSMYGTASFVLYAVVIALNDAIIRDSPAVADLDPPIDEETP